jgi:hypothetical protein
MTEEEIVAELKNMGFEKLAEDVSSGGWTAAALSDLMHLIRRAQPETAKEEKETSCPNQ